MERVSQFLGEFIDYHMTFFALISSDAAPAWVQALATALALIVSYGLGKHSNELQLRIETARRMAAEDEQRREQRSVYAQSISRLVATHGLVRSTVTLLESFEDEGKLNAAAVHASLRSLEKIGDMYRRLIFESFPSDAWIDEIRGAVFYVVSMSSQLEQRVARGAVHPTMGEMIRTFRTSFNKRHDHVMRHAQAFNETGELGFKAFDSKSDPQESHAATP